MKDTLKGVLGTGATLASVALSSADVQRWFSVATLATGFVAGVLTCIHLTIKIYCLVKRSNVGHGARDED